MGSSVVSELSYAVSIVKDTPDQRIGVAFASDDASSTLVRVKGLAAKAGLTKGDRITSINGISTINKDAKQIANMIRASIGEVRIQAETASQPYIWPDLYKEVGTDIVILSEFLVYELKEVFNYMKQRIREGQSVEGFDKIAALERPFTPLQLKKIFQDNIKILKEVFHDFKNPSMIYERIDELNIKSNNSRRCFTIQFYDKKVEEDDFAYLITKDSVDKRIILTFPGTPKSKTGLHDYMANVHHSMCKVAVPETIKGMPDKEHQVKIHRGLYDMLFKENNGEDDGSTPRTYDEIVSILKPLLEQYPDYKLFMTGLGLGGALATICSLYLACNSDIPTPVTCVSYGSPRVGDRDFLNTVQLLEKKRHLRIIRVVCNNDIVTTVPYFGYVHVGFEVRLFHKRDKEPLIKYPNLSWGVWKWTELCWQNSFKIGLNLGYNHFDYKRRMDYQIVKGALEGYELNQQYEDPLIVGYTADVYLE